MLYIHEHVTKNHTEILHFRNIRRVPGNLLLLGYMVFAVWPHQLFTKMRPTHNQRILWSFHYLKTMWLLGVEFETWYTYIWFIYIYYIMYFFPCFTELQTPQIQIYQNIWWFPGPPKVVNTQLFHLSSWCWGWKLQICEGEMGWQRMVSCLQWLHG